MYCVIRVNAYPHLGNGHLMRCLTLARIAQQQGCTVVFVLADYSNTPVRFIEAAGFNYVLVPIADELADAAHCAKLLEDLQAPCRVVVDVYALSATWHAFIYPRCDQLMVIDDLANRNYYCDHLLDHTPGRTAACYASWVNQQANIYAGCDHALLAPEFFAAVGDARKIRAAACSSKRPLKLLISLGGTDPKSLSQVWFNLLAPHLDAFAQVTFLLASNAVGLASLAKKIAIAQAGGSKVDLVVDARNVAQLLLQHDLAIGGAGVSALERAVLGLPSLLLTLADNQVFQAQTLIKEGCALDLGDWQQVPSLDVQQKALNSLLALVQDKTRYEYLSQQAFNLIAPGQPYQAVHKFLTQPRSDYPLSSGC